MNNNLVNCSKISVDCVKNDPVDIRCGGPDYLGFDFFVKEELTDDMEKFIYLTLKNLNVPLIRIYTNGKKVLEEKEIWTKEKIVQSIKKDVLYLQNEAKRNYHFSRK